MDNEKFQELVLEQLARLTQDNTELRTGQNELRAGQDELRANYKELRTGQDELRANYKELRTGQDELRVGQKELKAELKSLRSEVEVIKVKLDVVYNQTAKLTEDFTSFREETNKRLNSLSADVKYLKYKEAQNEEDLFILKTELQIIK